MKRVKIGEVIFFSVFALLLIYLCLCCGTVWQKGISIDGFMQSLGKTLLSPSNIHVTEMTKSFLILGLILWLLCLATYLVSRGNFLFGREMGSAKWGNPRRINKHLQQDKNVILSQKIRMGLNMSAAPKGHGRQLNTILIGGSGSGKTWYWVTPNLLQANTSYVVVDPAGDVLKDTGNFFKSKGYSIKVLNLVNMDKSDQYNPFIYCKEQNDFQVLIDNYWKSTEEKVVGKNDPFWDDAAKSLMLAVVFYLWETGDTINFHSISAMVGFAEPNEEKASPLDALFDKLHEQNIHSLAVRFYDSFKKGANKTKQSILQVLNAKLNRTMTEKFERMTAQDTLNLHELYGSEHPCILYLVIPTTNTTYNFLVSMLYTQLFEGINNYYMEHGQCKNHLRVIMDEAANIALPNDFAKIPAICRKYGYSIVLILQSISQLKTMFEREQWESVMGNMDTQIFLGNTEQSSHKYFSEVLGKATINYKTRGYKPGLSGNSNENIQLTGRELMTPDEIRNMSNKHCLVWVRDEGAVKDKKYNVQQHENFHQTASGGAKPYAHIPNRELVISKASTQPQQRIVLHVLDWGDMMPLDDKWGAA